MSNPTVTFSQTAPWSDGTNRLLRNGYRSRFTQVGQRYFKVSAQHLNDMWYVEQINADGTDYSEHREGLTHSQAVSAFLDGDTGALSFGLNEYVFRLSEAREAIQAYATTH